MIFRVFNPTGSGNTGTIQYFTVPVTGAYRFILKGAAGGIGTTQRSSSASYSPTPGKGAIVTGELQLTEGDELLIVVGQSGTSSVTTTTNGTGGGSGGATWVFRKVESITDSTYQIAINGVDGYWECLFCAAGGAGTEDAAYYSRSNTAASAAELLYSLAEYGTYKAFSTSTASISSSVNSSTPVLSLKQISTNGFQGAYYLRNRNYGYGGFGCGHAADNVYSAGGGWATSGTNYRASSWAAFGGQIAINESIEEGSLTIESVDQTPPALTISSPVDQLETTGSTVLVSGITSDPSGIISVSVNGTPVSVSISGEFQTTVPLAVGNNLIEIVSIDAMENAATETRLVRRLDVTPPVVDINSPSDGYQTYDNSVLIEGFTSDTESPIVSVSINGTNIEYDHDTGVFSVTMHLEPGRNIFTVSAEDSLGNTGFETIVITRKTYSPEELHPDHPQPMSIVSIDSVSLIPNPVGTSITFSIVATITEKYVYPSIDPLFEFPMDLDYTGLPVSELVFQ